MAVCMELSLEVVCPTEETVLALLDFLVDPLLPTKCLSKDPPSQEDLVAKQVYAVVLLYNYYHRKQSPGLEFLELKSFCNLAMALKPSLRPYMSLMQRSDNGGFELDGMDNYMSLTEKEVVNACDVARSLDASNDKPVIEGWPISKVAVFLVDFKRQNCFLFHSSITQGVWSVIEKEVTVPGEEGANKKRRVIKKTPKETQAMDEAILQQFAYSAVKEACAFNQGDLKILETHVVYSTSKAKTAVRLYIMQCRNSKQDEYLVPISDALESLEGPMVRKESGSWLLSPAVEYFHLLPFADIVSDWLSRSREIDANGMVHVEAEENGHCHNSLLVVEELPNSSHNFEEVNNPNNCISSHLNEKLVMNTFGSLGTAEEARNSNNHQSKKEIIPNLSQNHKTSQAVINSSSCQSKEKTLPSAPLSVKTAEDIQNGSTINSKIEPLPCVSNHSEMPKAPKTVENNLNSQTKFMMYSKRNKSQKSASSNCQGSKKDNATKGYLRLEKECSVKGSPSTDVHGKKPMIAAQEPDQSAFNGGAMVLAENLDTNSFKHNVDVVYSDQEEKQDRAIVTKIQAIASKENLLSRTALKVLYKKRELLSQQLRINEDEIDLCDRNIDIILEGGEEDLAVKIESIIQSCNDFLTSSATGNKRGLHFEDPNLKRRRKLSKANLSTLDPCQQLDTICNGSNWTLPTYDISNLEGGFKAVVTVKGVDSNCICEGIIAPTRQDARNSAALFMLAELQEMQWNSGR